MAAGFEDDATLLAAVRAHFVLMHRCTWYMWSHGKDETKSNWHVGGDAWALVDL